MTLPETIPICWKSENVGKAISIKAKIDEKQTHYFLACHSPMTQVQDEKSRRSITEEDLYKNLITSSQRDKQAVIYGEPGTGKSHLVHWLKLRFDYGIESGELTNVVPVLIERRSGSLKDALTQLIEQLGVGFQKYLDPVQQALEKLSSATARQMLVNELSLELGPRWTDRGREIIDKRLKHLGQACRAEGFGGWLCRDGGVIEQTIELLTESSDVAERENSPSFKPEDLLVKERFRTRRKNSQEVLDLIDELDDSKTLREVAADHLNAALKDAIVDMVGLSGANLRKVFDSIRNDLASDDKQLALFIEDVSAMSELDVEIVNALEPQDRTDLCPLTAILGMTHTGYAKLRDNQKQRIEFVYRVDGETTETWSQDKDSLARFCARYLNAVRLDEESVRDIAENRRQSNSDVQTSKCESCPAKSQCHATFGYVQIEDVEIGLYPFSKETAPRVLELIRQDEASPYSANQRGLLIRLLSPVLSDTESLAQHRFPNATTLPVSVSDPYYWTEFQQNYLGEHSETDRDRIRILAGLWIQRTDDSNQAAGLLSQYIQPLRLPSFTKEAMKSVEEKRIDPKRETGNSGVSTDVKAKTRREIQKYLDSLSGWLRSEPLKHETYFRDLLSGLVKNSVRWEDHLQPAQFDNWTWSVVGGRKFINIEGQSASAERLSFEFPRNDETRSLLEAMCRYDKEGKKSWDFDQSEIHKRTVSRWLREHERAIIERLEPEVDRENAIRAAVQFLSLFSVIRDRSTLPQKSVPELMNRLLSRKWEEVPTALSKEWQTLLDNMSDRHQQVLEFLKNEISVRQGRGGVNFVSPVQVVDIASGFQRSPQVLDLPSQYFSGFWKSRFTGLPNQASPEKHRFENLKQIIEAEQRQIRDVVDWLRNQLTDLGFSATDMKKDVSSLCDQVMEVHETIKTAKIAYPDSAFDDLVKAKTFTVDKMELSNVVSKAAKIAVSENVFDVLTFDPKPLLQCRSVVAIVVKRIQQLDDYIKEQEDEIKEGGDPELFVSQMFDALGLIAELNEEILESHHAKTS